MKKNNIDLNKYSKMVFCRAAAHHIQEGNIGLAKMFIDQNIMRHPDTMDTCIKQLKKDFGELEINLIMTAKKINWWEKP
jgi:hypothetical protein